MGDITYEELFEFLRRERNSEELQTLEPGFYASLVSYFEDKQAVVEDESEEAKLFGSSEKDKVKIQLENAKKISKELVERREKKIIILALNKARTQSDIIDTSSLLDVEQEFFHQCADLFASYKKGVLENMISMKAPVFGGVVSEKPEPSDVPGSSDESSEDGGEIEEGSAELDIGDEPEIEDDDTIIEDEEPEIDIETGETESVAVKVKFNSLIPKFMGKDEQVYGPYEPDQEAELERDVAQILISKGKAEQV